MVNKNMECINSTSKLMLRLCQPINWPIIRTGNSLHVSEVYSSLHPLSIKVHLTDNNWFVLMLCVTASCVHAILHDN